MDEIIRPQDEGNGVDAQNVAPPIVDAKIGGISHEARNAVIATGDGLRVVRHDGIQRRVRQGV